MKIIVGLGNVGHKFINNRHNVGFMVVNKLAIHFGCHFKLKKNLHSLLTSTKIQGENVIFIKPTTMMNDSGISIKSILEYYNVNLKNLIVICDDIDRDYGKIRIKKSGSSGGHNGLKSIIHSLKTDDFIRIRIGIGRPPHNPQSVINHVLGDFTKEQFELVEGQINKAVLAIIDFAEGKPFNKITNYYNN